MNPRIRNVVWTLVGLVVVVATFTVAALIPSRYTCPEVGYAPVPVPRADGRQTCLYIGLYGRPAANARVSVLATDANEHLRWWIAGVGAMLAFLMTPRWWGLWRSRGGVWGSAVPAPPEDFTEDGI